MKNKKYKILVLSDLNKSTDIILKSTISLAKIIDGEIDFLCVKKPTDIVEKDNQLSAIRNINQQHFGLNKKLKNLITPISKEYNININHTISYGNVKSEIDLYLKEYQPDIVVLGKRKSKLFSLIGDNIAQFVFKKHKGAIMLSSNKNPLEPNKKLNLGLLNDTESSLEFAKDLIEQTQKPVKSFKIVNKLNRLKETNNLNSKEKIEFVFEENDNTINNLSNYLLKNNVNLLCVNRESKRSEDGKQLMNADVNNVIDKLNVSLLLTA